MHLFRIFSLVAIGLLPQALSAGPSVDTSCALKPGQSDNCVPFVGCIGDDGTYFTGRVFGWGEGTLAASRSDGPTCTGGWRAGAVGDLGQGFMTCDDGVEAVVYYYAQDSETGTVIGRGATNDGRSVKVWSGHNIRQFLKNESGAVDAWLLCGGTRIPIS